MSTDRGIIGSRRIDWHRSDEENGSTGVSVVHSSTTRSESLEISTYSVDVNHWHEAVRPDAMMNAMKSGMKGRVLWAGIGANLSDQSSKELPRR